MYIYTYIYIHIARGLTFAGNPRNSMRDCDLLRCYGACFSQTASIPKYWYYLCLIAFLRLPETVPKSPLKHF